MTDDPVAICTVCGAASARVFHPPAVHFKGSGFYTTDYGKRARSAAGDSSTDARKDGDAGAAKKAGSGSTDKAGASTAGSGSSRAGPGSSDS